jgi:hypothetical protein
MAQLTVKSSVLISLSAVIAVVGAYDMSSGAKRPAPGTFDFDYFESLKESRILPEAREFIEYEFLLGSPVNRAVTAFEAAGAKCGNGTDYFGPYIGCDYSRRDHGLLRSIFVTVEWKIDIRPNTDGVTIKSISANRGLTSM